MYPINQHDSVFLNRKWTGAKVSAKAALINRFSKQSLIPNGIAPRAAS